MTMKCFVIEKLYKVIHKQIMTALQPEVTELHLHE
jgi:hypothetical protein